MNHAVISIGSNIQPQRHVQAALDMLASHLELLAHSAIVQTRPIDRPLQDDYLNTCALVATDMDRPALEHWLHDVEAALGRVRSADKFAPRTIDLDVIVWNGEIVDGDVHEREFLRAAVEELKQQFPMLNAQFPINAQDHNAQ